MDNFSKQRFENENDAQYINVHDRYMEDLNKKLKARRTEGLVDEALEGSLLNEKDQAGSAKARAMNAAKLWGGVMIAVTNSAIVYSPSVKFARKVLKLKGFWNIHFAVFPMITTYNAITIGLLTAAYANYEFHQTYQYV